MFRLKWLPWRFVIRRVARAHGFLDPIALLSRLRRLAAPSEVAEPIELLRAGVVLHARGLINSRVIQHNLDWVWPYWVERQFDPTDDAFVPRAFSITHINLTHRNWTALGVPDCDALPIVDPRGLLTPRWDGWSLDAWVVADDGARLLPARAAAVAQRLDLNAGVSVTTAARANGLRLDARASVSSTTDAIVCRLELEARADRTAWLVVALRPYNPEGISFIHTVSLSPDRTTWTIDGRDHVAFDAPADRHHVSSYRAGDVYIHLNDLQDQSSGSCDVGMVTAAACFRLNPGAPRRLGATIPLQRTDSQREPTWGEALRGHCVLEVPDDRVQFLYDAALRTLILHSPGDVYPGPYTYKRFWFRDAAFIMHALLCAGFDARVERALDKFPARQTARGYFRSQDGEWDANGEALWIMHRYCALTGRPPKPAWWTAARQGARWIQRKRLPDGTGAPHAGLLPAGFSAEHLGPNDFYYWDDFWGIAGLRAVSALALDAGDAEAATLWWTAAEEFTAAVERSLARVADRLGRPAMPASPYRRLDAGAIGSLAAGYPIPLFAPEDPRLLDTVAYLLAECFVHGGFFQDMIHSGINPYLTLHVAQVLLRAGDPRFTELLTTVADLASPTGQWPEAIHPRTGGGCMGDGQHVWAAAEWLLMLRNCFVREEDDRLVLASGVSAAWLASGARVRLGPAPTPFGPVTVTVQRTEGRTHIGWQGAWRGPAPAIEVRLPGHLPCPAPPGSEAVVLQPEAGA